MKAVRLFSVVMALALFAGAIFPFAAQPVAAQASQSIMVTSPVQAFVDATRGMPLLAPMSVTLPLITMSVDSVTGTGYACTWVKQTPKDYTRMKSRQYFDMAWTVQNSGTRVWHKNATTLKYIAGTKMQSRSNSIGLLDDVGRGEKVKLVVDMIAPKLQGIYSTLWGLTTGNTSFCRLTLTIGVSGR